MNRALSVLLLPVFVIVVCCAALARRAERVIDDHPLGGFIGAVGGLAAFLLTVALGNLLGAALS